MMKLLYLDHAATTTTYPEVVSVIKDIVSQDLGNASSVHIKGKQARTHIDRSRIILGTCFNVPPSQVIFTSGATESLHLAIVGGYLEQTQRKSILISPTAHSCIQKAVDFLVKYHDAIRIDVPLLKNGHFDILALESINLEEVSLVVVEHGNSETGVLQNIEGLGMMIQNVESKPFYIVDTVASIVSCPGVFDLANKEWKPDYICVSGEKVGGIAGSGALIQLSENIITGIQKGSQEFGLRGGTENIVGIAALAKALELHYRNKQEVCDAIQDVLAYAEYQIGEQFPFFTKLGGDMYMGHVLVYLLPKGMKSDLFVTRCDMKGLCISSGSACSSGTVGGNKALEALGFSVEESGRSIRLSFGRNTKKADIDQALSVMQDIVQ